MQTAEHTPKVFVSLYSHKRPYAYLLWERSSQVCCWEGRSRRRSACSWLAVSGASWSSLTSVPSRFDPKRSLAIDYIQFIQRSENFSVSVSYWDSRIADCSQNFPFEFCSSIFCLFCAFPWRKLFRPRELVHQRRVAEREGGKNRDCRSVYDKISNRLERRRQRRADDSFSAIFRVFFRVEILAAAASPWFICAYMCKSVSMDIALLYCCTD